MVSNGVFGILAGFGHIDHAIRFVYVPKLGNWLLVRGHADRVGPFLFGATWVGQLEHTGTTAAEERLARAMHNMRLPTLRGSRWNAR